MNTQPALPYDRAQVIENFGGDEDLFRQVAQVFLADWPEREAQLRTALATGEAERLRVAAHTIKGSVGNFSAARAAEAARALELACKAGNLADAPAQIEAVLAAVGEFTAALRAELP